MLLSWQWLHKLIRVWPKTSSRKFGLRQWIPLNIWTRSTARTSPSSSVNWWVWASSSHQMRLRYWQISSLKASVNWSLPITAFWLSLQLRIPHPNSKDSQIWFQPWTLTWPIRELHRTLKDRKWWVSQRVARTVFKCFMIFIRVRETLSHILRRNFTSTSPTQSSLKFPNHLTTLHQSTTLPRCSLRNPSQKSTLLTTKWIKIWIRRITFPCSLTSKLPKMRN